jgi:glutathione synthase/RimK-type ligase-like ATP-grasp enzyme
MILIITHKGDFTADFVIDKLNKQEIKYYRFNCEDIDKENYLFSKENHFTFQLSNLNSFHSVWFRRTKLPDLQVENESEKLYFLGEYDSLLNNLFMQLNTKKWLSNPTFVYQAENKIFQLQIAQKIGFKIPDTIITNQHSVLKGFLSKHNNNIIVKPLSQGRIRNDSGLKLIYTSKITTNIIDKIDTYSLTPSIYQEYIAKEYELRITVVNKKVFAAKVDSQKYDGTKTDWRKAKIPFEKYLLPIDIEIKCIELVQKLNLAFGAIDMIKNSKGDYVFLEINPNGQWAWLDIEAGLNISQEIITYLTE